NQADGRPARAAAPGPLGPRPRRQEAGDRRSVRRNEGGRRRLRPARVREPRGGGGDRSRSSCRPDGNDGGAAALGKLTRAHWSGLHDGASRARTGDLLRATQALSQLSYGPVRVGQFSRELVIGRPIDLETLVIRCCRQTQLDRLAPDLREWEEVTTVEFE